MVRSNTVSFVRSETSEPTDGPVAPSTVDSASIDPSTTDAVPESPHDSSMTNNNNNDDDDTKMHAARYRKTEADWNELLAQVCSFANQRA